MIKIGISLFVIVLADSSWNWLFPVQGQALVMQTSALIISEHVVGWYCTATPVGISPDYKTQGCYLWVMAYDVSFTGQRLVYICSRLLYRRSSEDSLWLKFPDGQIKPSEAQSAWMLSVSTGPAEVQLKLTFNWILLWWGYMEHFCCSCFCK